MLAVASILIGLAITAFAAATGVTAWITLLVAIGVALLVRQDRKYGHWFALRSEGYGGHPGLRGLTVSAIVCALAAYAIWMVLLGVFWLLRILVSPFVG